MQVLQLQVAQLQMMQMQTAAAAGSGALASTALLPSPQMQLQMLQMQQQQQLAVLQAMQQPEQQPLQGGSGMLRQYPVIGAPSQAQQQQQQQQQQYGSAVENPSSSAVSAPLLEGQVAPAGGGWGGYGSVANGGTSGGGVRDW